MPERTTTSKALRLILGIIIALVIVFAIMIVASIALWTGGFTVGR